METHPHNRKHYRTVFCSEERPTENGEYFTDQGCINWVNDRWYAFEPTWYLKETTIPESMHDFAEYCWKEALFLPDGKIIKGAFEEFLRKRE